MAKVSLAVKLWLSWERWNTKSQRHQHAWDVSHSTKVGDEIVAVKPDGEITLGHAKVKVAVLMDKRINAFVLPVDITEWFLTTGRGLFCDDLKMDKGSVCLYFVLAEVFQMNRDFGRRE